jgi:hypothetical protein
VGIWTITWQVLGAWCGTMAGWTLIYGKRPGCSTLPNGSPARALLEYLTERGATPEHPVEARRLGCPPHVAERRQHLDGASYARSDLPSAECVDCLSASRRCSSAASSA